MGFLDIFKKQKTQSSNEEIEPVMPQTRLPYSFNIDKKQKNCVQIDFHDYELDFKQFYDTTRLVVDERPINLAGAQVYSCKVSWYNESDAIYFNRETGQEYGSRTDYTDVLAGMDLLLLQTDSSYAHMLMKNLLNKKRVEEYINRGLTEEPKIPCGKYIGGVELENNKCTKKFYTQAGEASHYSPEVVEARIEHRRELEQRKNQQIAGKQAQIERLKKEIDKIK